MNRKELFFWFGLLLVSDGVLSDFNGWYGWFTPGNGLDVWWIQYLRFPRILIGGYLIWLASK